MFSLNYITNIKIKILVFLFFLISTSCFRKPEIIENIEEPDDKYINSYLTWEDPPFWIDSLDRYSSQRLDSLDLNYLLWNNKKLNSIYSEIFDDKIKKNDHEITVLINSNDSKEFEINLLKGVLIYKSDTISKWEIKDFKQKFKNSYNWRNMSQTGYQERLDSKNDSIYDAISFRISNHENLIFHFVQGRPVTLHYVFDLSLY